MDFRWREEELHNWYYWPNTVMKLRGTEYKKPTGSPCLTFPRTTCFNPKVTYFGKQHSTNIARTPNNSDLPGSWRLFNGHPVRYLHLSWRYKPFVPRCFVLRFSRKNSDVKRRLIVLGKWKTVHKSLISEPEGKKPHGKNRRKLVVGEMRG